MPANEPLRIPVADVQSTFTTILLKHGFTAAKALHLAQLFTANTVDGVYTHGVNRFPVFIEYVKEGLIDIAAEPTLVKAFNAIEQWNGNLGPGPLNAVFATDRAATLAQQYGIGCVAMANTNHWMRGGYYGWEAAKKGVAFMGWTNTIANLPAWGSVECRLGNNPIVLAVPYGDSAVVLDMAMSQASFGAMQQSADKGEKLPVPGGYTKDGVLTDDPAAIIESKRPLPIGYWKGAGMALLLDLLAAVLSGGLATHEITKAGKEKGVSQVFICMDLGRLGDASVITRTLAGIIDDYQGSAVPEGTRPVSYPGQRVLKTREENLRDGVPVLQAVWAEVKAL